MTGTQTESWTVRPTDFDVLGHVNNAVYWSMIDDDRMVRGKVILEYRVPIEPAEPIDLLSSADGSSRWLVGGGTTRAAATIVRREPEGTT